MYCHYSEDAVLVRALSGASTDLDILPRDEVGSYWASCCRDQEVICDHSRATGAGSGSDGNTIKKAGLQFYCPLHSGSPLGGD